VAIFTAVSDEEVRTFLVPYGLSLHSLAGIPAGSVNSNFRLLVEGSDAAARPVFLRIYEEQGREGAEREAGLLATLAGAEVPTPAPILDRAGRAIGTLRHKPAALFPWRAGGMRCQASVSPADVSALGAALARLHVTGAGAQGFGPGRFRRTDLEVRLAAIEGAADATFRPLASPLRAALATVDDARDRALPSGLVHGDLFRDNVLFDEAGRLVALLDFESAFEGTFAFDLAVCVLSWTFGDDLDLALGRAMVRGYESIRVLSPVERRGFYEEARFAALRFTITRITDYAMRAGHGPRVMKDYRRFQARFDALTALGPGALARALFED